MPQSTENEDPNAGKDKTNSVGTGVTESKQVIPRDAIEASTVRQLQVFAELQAKTHFGSENKIFNADPSVVMECIGLLLFVVIGIVFVRSMILDAPDSHVGLHRSEGLKTQAATAVLPPGFSVTQHPVAPVHSLFEPSRITSPQRLLLPRAVNHLARRSARALKSRARIRIESAGTESVGIKSRKHPHKPENEPLLGAHSDAAFDKKAANALDQLP